MLSLTYEYKATPTNEQIQLIEHTLTLCRTVWNFALCERKDWLNKVNKNYTSQVCPQCDTHTGKKDLSDRIHSCSHCGYTTHRDVAAAQVVRNRGLVQLSEGGRLFDVKEIAWVGGLTGTGNRLIKSQRSRKKKA